MTRNVFSLQKGFLRTGLLKLVLSFLALSNGLSPLSAQQVTLTTAGATNYTGGNGVTTSGTNEAAITFVIENTNAVDYVLKNVDVYFLVASNGGTANLWYSATSLSGAVTIATPAWNKINSTPAPITVPADGYVNVFSNLNFTIPANTTYRFAVVSNKNIRYSGLTPAPSPNTFSGSGINLHAGAYQINGANVGYGGLLPPPNTPRWFTGAVMLEPKFSGNCTPFANFIIDSVTDASFKVNWTPGTGNTSFYLEYGTAGFTRGSGTKITGIYPGSQPPVYITGLAQLTNYDVYFGEVCNSGSDTIDNSVPILVSTLPSCPPPASAAFVSATSATAMFNVQSGATAFAYEVGLTGFTQGTGMTGTGSNPLTISGLSPGTTYDVYIKNDCSANGKGTSAWIGPFTFITTCVTQSLPYMEDFNLNLGCFTAMNGGASFHTWQHVLNFNGSTLDGSGFAFVNSDAAGSGAGLLYERLVSPPVNAGSLTGSLILEFDQFFNNLTVNSDSGIVEVFNGTQWVKVYSVSTDLGSFGNPGHQTIDVTPYANANFQVRFVYNDNTTWAWYWAVDNVSLTEVLCIDPINITVQGLTAGSATFSFGSSGSLFDYEVGPAGFVQGTGMTGSGGNPLTISGLQANTSYDLYVRNNCTGVGSGTSAWAGPVSFTTLCTPVAAPYLEDFENFTVGFHNGIENCWKIINNVPIPASLTSNYVWQVRNTAQTSSGTGTGPDRDNTLAPAIGGKFLTADVSYGVAGDSTMLLSPLIDVSSLTSPELSFYYHKWGLSNVMPDIRVDIFDGTWHNNYAVISGVTNTSPADPYKKAVIYLTGLNDTVQVRITLKSIGCCAGDAAIDDFEIREAPLCPEVQLPFVSALSSTSASLTFNSAGTAFDFEYGPAGFVQGTGTVVSGGNPFTITGLSPATSYQVYIRNNCTSSGNGNSLWVGPVSFTTTCIETTMPYYESFDTWPLPCIDTTGGVNYWRKFNGPAGDNYAEADFWGISTGDFLMTTQPVVVDKKAQVRFRWSHLYSATYPNDQLMVEVQKMSTGVWDTVLSLIGPAFDDPTAGNSNTPGQFINEIIFLDSATYVGDTIRVRLRAITGFGPDLFVNDLYVEEIPACPPPTKINLGVLTSSSATVGVTGLGSTFDYEYGLAGFTPGMGTIVSGGNPALISGLQPNTTYHVYARSMCGSNLSAWIGPLAFTTLCAPLTAPYIWDFEQSTVGFFNGFDNCWNIVNKTPNPAFVTSGYAWEVRNTAQTSSTGTGPDRDNTLAPSMGGRFVTADVSYGVAGDSTMLISPLVDISGLTNPELEFYFHMYGTILAELHVDIFDGASWNNNVLVLTQQYQTSPSQAYRDTSISLSQFNADTVQVRFRAQSNGCCAGDVAIDDVRISDPIACLRPTNLMATGVTATGANLAWTPGTSGNTSFQIEYGINLSTVGSGIRQTVTGSTYALTGLTPSTSYCYFVREICGNGDTSLWRGPVCFTTGCLPVVMPYYESFDTWPLTCWETAGGTDNWFQYNGLAGDNYARANFWSWAAGRTGVLTSNAVTLSQDAQVRFDWSHLYNTTYPNDELMVRAQVAGSGVWDTILSLKAGAGNFNDPTAGNTTPGSFITQEIILDPAIYTGHDVIVELRAISGFGPDVFVNNFYIEAAPSCPPPGALSGGNITSTAVDVSWTSTNNVPGNLWIDTVGFNPVLNPPVSAGGRKMAGVNTPYTITGLTANTCYDVYIQDSCGAADVSRWIGPFRFCTACTAASAPFADSLETATVGFFNGADNCWTIVSNNPGTTPSGGYSWEIRNTTQTTSGGTGPLGDNTLFPALGGKFLTADVSGSAIGDSTMFISPLIDLATVSNPGLEYYYHMYGTVAEMAELHVDIHNGTAWVRDVHVLTSVAQASSAAAYNDTTADLSAYAGQTIRVRFRAISKGCCAGDIAIDDISITGLPSACPAPTGLNVANISCTGATLSWTSSSPGPNSILEYGLSGFTPGTGSGTVMAFVQSPLTLTGLIPGTAYQFYVMDTCGGSTVSAVSGPGVFATAAAASASFTFTNGVATATGLTVSFNASSSVGAGSYSWDFGDGGTGTGVAPTHMYAANGTYTVTLTITGNCGTATYSTIVMIQGIGMEENIISRSLEIYPNPTSGGIAVKFSTGDSDDVVVTLSDLSGKVVMSVKENVNGRYSGNLDLSKLAKGIYILKAESGEISITRRVVRQ